MLKRPVEEVEGQSIIEASGSQPVVRTPPVVRSHLPGGPQARPNINLNLRGKYAKNI